MKFEHILKCYHKIDDYGKLELYEHNVYGEDEVIAVDHCYNRWCFTYEALDYVANNDDEFEWHNLIK